LFLSIAGCFCTEQLLHKGQFREYASRDENSGRLSSEDPALSLQSAGGARAKGAAAAKVFFAPLFEPRGDERMEKGIDQAGRARRRWKWMN
jgi:hypothetical protein